MHLLHQYSIRKHLAIKENTRNRSLPIHENTVIWEARRKERSDARVVAHEGTFKAIEPEKRRPRRACNCSIASRRVLSRERWP